MSWNPDSFINKNQYLNDLLNNSPEFKKIQQEWDDIGKSIGIGAQNGGNFDIAGSELKTLYDESNFWNYADSAGIKPDESNDASKNLEDKRKDWAASFDSISAEYRQIKDDLKTGKITQAEADKLFADNMERTRANIAAGNELDKLEEANKLLADDMKQTGANKELDNKPVGQRIGTSDESNDAPKSLEDRRKDWIANFDSISAEYRQIQDDLKTGKITQDEANKLFADNMERTRANIAAGKELDKLEEANKPFGQRIINFNRDGAENTFDSTPITSSNDTSSPTTSSPATSSPATSSPTTSNPATSSPATSSPVASSPATSSPVASNPVHNEPLTSEQKDYYATHYEKAIDLSPSQREDVLNAMADKQGLTGMERDFFMRGKRAEFNMNVDYRNTEATNKQRELDHREQLLNARIDTRQHNQDMLQGRISTQEETILNEKQKFLSNKEKMIAYKEQQLSAQFAQLENPYERIDELEMPLPELQDVNMDVIYHPSTALPGVKFERVDKTKIPDVEYTSGPGRDSYYPSIEFTPEVVEHLKTHPADIKYLNTEDQKKALQLEANRLDGYDDERKQAYINMRMNSLNSAGSGARIYDESKTLSSDLTTRETALNEREKQYRSGNASTTFEHTAEFNAKDTEITKKIGELTKKEKELAEKEKMLEERKNTVAEGIAKDIFLGQKDDELPILMERNSNGVHETHSKVKDLSSEMQDLVRSKYHQITRDAVSEAGYRNFDDASYDDRKNIINKYRDNMRKNS